MNFVFIQIGDIDTLSTRDAVPNITPFLASNQVPGPFRPIALNKNQLQIYNGDIDQADDVSEPQQYLQRQSNSIQSFRELQSKPIKYATHLNSNQQYMQVVPAKIESTIKSSQHDQLKQYYELPIHGTDVKTYEYVTHGSPVTSALKTHSGLNAEFNNHK